MRGKRGSFTISLDFELYWGVRDKRSIESYKQNLLGVWEVIPKMLAMFQKYNIHTTWATVGFLFLKDEQAFKNNLPDLLPHYENNYLSPYTYFETLKSSDFSSEEFNRMHFAKALIEKIKQVPFQEIAMHTYSHYYTREPIISVEVFESDLKQAIKVASEENIIFHSLVFPRNQIDNGSLEKLKDMGIKIYRGNPDHWAYREGEMEKTFLQRLYRFIDIYLNLSGTHSSLPKVNALGLTEAKSSMFMRPYSKKFKFLEYMKLRRIKSAMSQAAQDGKNFHLWWHPHNFGVNQSENLHNLEEILRHFEMLQTKYHMRSLNMKELGDQ